MRWALGAAALALSAAACGQVDDRPADWSYISPAIMQPACASASCHSPAAAAAGLDFSTPERGYTSLTQLYVWIAVASDAGAPPGGVPCGHVAGTLVCEEPFRRLVTPYDPAGSRLVNLLRARDATRMPPDRPLTEPDIALIERWILNGACAAGTSCQDAAFPDVDAGAPRPATDGGTGG